MKKPTPETNRELIKYMTRTQERIIEGLADLRGEIANIRLLVEEKVKK